MSYLLKKSLLMVALTATIAVAQAGMAIGQLPGGGFIQAVVDIGTGEIILELGPDIQVLGIVLDAPGPGVIEDAFNIAALDETTGLGTAGQAGPGGIGFLGLIPFPAGTFNLGAILAEPFRTLDGVAGLLVQFGGAGDNDPITVANGGITVINTIPEPSSLSLLALASLGVVARRRR